MIENYFAEKLNPDKCTNTFVFDSFPDEKDKDGKDKYSLR